MSSLLKLRRGSTIAHETFTGAEGEVTFDTDKNAIVTHDGSTAGGFPHMKSAELAASGGSALVGYLPAGGSTTTVQNKLRKYATDSTAPESSDTGAYATMAVNGTRTTINRHAFEDWTTIATTSETGQGYSSFDANVTMTNTSSQSHLVGYQVRHAYQGSGGLADYMHGYDCALSHTGTGIIDSVVGMQISGTSGTGPITNEYGVVIGNIGRGSVTNWGIWSAFGNRHYLGGTTGYVTTGTVEATQLVRSFANIECDATGGYNSNLYYSSGWKYRANGAGFSIYTTAGLITFGVATVNAGGINAAAVVNTAFTVNVSTFETAYEGPVSPKAYTYANLPSATVGAIAFCSNGRKVGEGPGAGTGVPVYYTTGNWRVFSTDAPVLA